MELIDKQKLLEAIERKRLDYIDADEDYEADVLEIWMDEIESGKFDHSAQEEIPGWEEIAGIQEAKAVQAEQETARLRDKLKQIDGQRMQTEQERCYFKKKAETYIEDIAWLEGKVSELEARAIQAEHERDKLAEFVKDMIRDGCWNIDGSDLQDKAEKNGFLREEVYDPDKHGEDFDGEPGVDTIYVFAGLLERSNP